MAPASRVPVVVRLVAFNAPQVNEEFVVLPVIMFPEEFIINKLLLPVLGLMILLAVIVIVPVVFPKLTVCPGAAAAVRDPVLVAAKVVAPAFNVPAVLILPAFRVPVVVRLVAFNAPQVNEEFVVLEVMTLLEEFIIKKLLFPALGLVILLAFSDIEPVGFPNQIVWPGLLAAFNVPRFAVPPLIEPEVVMLVADKAPVLVNPAQVNDEFVVLLVSTLPKTSIMSRL